jgi:hypothetical protein
MVKHLSDGAKMGMKMGVAHYVENGRLHKAVNSGE